MMWVLVIVMLTLPNSETVVASFETLKACQLERDRIGFEMANAYPEEPTFTIKCQYRAGHVRPIPARY
jgi:hypothetical protein